ncbi:Uma2 family endonuclease [Caballeronia sp.]|uniref:Uma2 family endonuclease n=1 Tax=Caballeronia sp. TaxID=1931223 RepID=UPI003C45BEA4
MKTHLLQQDSLLAIWRTLAVRRDFAVPGFELSPTGDILVRDEDPWHQIFKTDVFCQLATQLGPRVALRLPVITRSFGVLVPDVVWMPDEKWPDDDAEQATNPLTFAPDLCVEVLFGNAVCAVSLDNRIQAYLRSGAQEVIVVGADGTVEFRGREGVRGRSVFNVTLDLGTSYFFAAGSERRPLQTRSAEPLPKS